MGLGLSDLGGYPPRVSNAHRYFNPEQIKCPACGSLTVPPTCEGCGTVLDDDAIRDALEDAMTPPEWA